MSETISEATGQRYGIQRVCQAWERSRSALSGGQIRDRTYAASPSVSGGEMVLSNDMRTAHGQGSAE